MSHEKLNVDIPGIDSNKGLSLCDGDMDIYLNSLRLCVSNMPATLEKMRHVTEATLHDYTICVHGAKGICSYIGAEEARALGKDLEDKARGGDLAGVLANNEAFLKIAGTLVENIRSWLLKNKLGT